MPECTKPPSLGSYIMQSCSTNGIKMETQSLVTSIDDIVTTMDDDSTRFAEMILNKARFHRILVESLELGVKKEKKEEKRRKSKSAKKKKRDKKRGKAPKKDKEKKEKTKKEQDEKTREKVIEKLKKKGYEEDEKSIQKAIRKIKRKKRKLKKEKEEKKKTSSKKKKKASPKKKKKKKKRGSKSSKPCSTVDVSENDSCDESFNYWWSIGNQNYESTPTRIVNKLPHSSPKKKKKNAKQSSKTGIDSTDHSNATESATEKTEHTSRCSLASSQQWSFSSPIVRKLTEESTEGTNDRVVMWWDKVQDVPAKLPTMMPIRTPATTPTMASRRSVIPMLLSPRSDTSDSDYDDVSIFSEESLSEQILDDLSCILDCSDDSDTDYPETPKSKKASLRSISNKSYDTSSICSGPFPLISPLRKKTSFKEHYGEEIVTPPSERHLASVKILGCRPSPYSSPSSQGSSEHSNSISPTTTSQTGSPTTEKSSPAPEEPETPVELDTPIDGISPVSHRSVFGNRKVEVSPRIPSLPTNVPLT